MQPRVAIMQNGTRKGARRRGDARRCGRRPGLEDIWQLHWSYNAGIELNSPGVFIANIDDPATIAGVLTAPPRGGGPGRGGGRGGQGGAPPNPAAAPGADGGNAPSTGVRAPSPARRRPRAPRNRRAPTAGGRRRRRGRRRHAAGGGPADRSAGRRPGRSGRRAVAAAARPRTPRRTGSSLSVQPDGSFTVTNSRNGFSKTYAKR